MHLFFDSGGPGWTTNLLAVTWAMAIKGVVAPPPPVGNFFTFGFLEMSLATAIFRIVISPAWSFKKDTFNLHEARFSITKPAMAAYLNVFGKAILCW